MTIDDFPAGEPRPMGAIDRARGAALIAAILGKDAAGIENAINDAAEDSNPLGVHHLIVVLGIHAAGGFSEGYGEAALQFARDLAVQERLAADTEAGS